MLRIMRFGIGTVMGIGLGLYGLWGLAPELFGPVAALAQTVPVKSPPTAARLPTVEDVKPPLPIRITATVDGTMLNVTERGAMLANAELVGWNGPGQDGRCVVVWSPDVTLTNITFAHGNDDALGFVGDCHGALVVDGKFPVNDWRPGRAHALIGYTDPVSSALVGPIFGRDVGCAANYWRCDFGGGAIRLSAGIWEFVDCAFTVGQLYGMDLTDAKINLIRPRFRTIPMPKDAGYWYDAERGPCPIRVGGAGKDRSKNLKSRIHIAGALLDDKPVEGYALCQRITDGKVPGHGAMGPGSVPASCFVKEPVSK